MQRILIYGDSNVWGYSFKKIQFKPKQRWTNQLAKALGADYEVIANGVSGRTAGSHQLQPPHLDGRIEFEKLLPTLPSLDMVIIALGSNDLKTSYHRNAIQIAGDLRWYRSHVNQQLPRAEVIFLLPANHGRGDKQRDNLRDELIDIMQNTDGLETIELEAIDLADYVHYSKKGHRQVGRIVSDYIKSNTQKPD